MKSERHMLAFGRNTRHRGEILQAQLGARAYLFYRKYRHVRPCWRLLQSAERSSTRWSRRRCDVATAITKKMGCCLTRPAPEERISWQCTHRILINNANNGWQYPQLVNPRTCIVGASLRAGCWSDFVVLCAVLLLCVV